MDIAILGGGASGLCAAISLARKGYKVTVFESKARIGQKILLTGNGRCNLTNLNLSSKNYHSNRPDIVEKIISQNVLEFFKSIGLYTRSKDGLVYPLSNKASSVLDLLRTALAKHKVEIVTEYNGLPNKPLIIATGLKANNGTDSGLKILKNFGHKIIEPYPALVQLKSDDAFLKGLKGVKFNGSVKVRQGNNILREEHGEILITDYGLSGIAVMQVSYLFSLYKDCTLELDLVPDMSREELAEYQKNFCNLIGLVEKKLSERILKHNADMKSITVNITGHNGFKNAQVCGGGASLDDFNEKTLESRHTKGLYAIGEVLDVVGDCGGYNLHWAFASALYVSESL